MLKTKTSFSAKEINELLKAADKGDLIAKGILEDLYKKVQDELDEQARIYEAELAFESKGRK